MSVLFYRPGQKNTLPPLVGLSLLFDNDFPVSAFDVFKKKPYERENSDTGTQHLEHPIGWFMILLHPNTENVKDEGGDHTHHEAEDLI